jgi:hypothetical protein
MVTDSTFDIRLEMVPEFGSEKLCLRCPRATQTAQEALEEIQLVAPSLPAPDRVALAPLIAEMMIFHYFHHLEERFLVNPIHYLVRYCHHLHHNNPRTRERNRRSTLLTSSREILRTRRSPIDNGFEVWIGVLVHSRRRLLRGVPSQFTKAHLP